MNPLTPDQRETLRHVVLDVLATRHPIALPPRGLRRYTEPECAFRFSDDDLNAACEFWRRDGAEPFLTCDFDPAGSTKWWRATSAGLLHAERAG